MEERFNKEDRIFLAGSTGMVGSSIKRALLNLGYGKDGYRSNNDTCKKRIRSADTIAVKNWFIKNKPTIVILSAESGRNSIKF